MTAAEIIESGVQSTNPSGHSARSRGIHIGYSKKTDFEFLNRFLEDVSYEIFIERTTLELSSGD